MNMRKPAEVKGTSSTEKVNLKVKDKEIINILTYNSRTPLSQIAKYLKTSTEVISYHYNNLKRKNIITDVFTIIDPKLLGIHRYCVYLQLHALSQEKMKQIIQEFLKNEHINWVIETGGKWEIIIMFETIHEEKYEEILESILAPNRLYLNDYMIVTVKDFVQKSPRYIKNLKKEEVYSQKIRFPYAKEFSMKKEPSQLDEKDILLLKLLHEDSRLSLTELGESLGLSKDAIDYRIKNLISTGIIKKFIIRLNYHLLNFQYTTIMLKLASISPYQKKEFLQYIYRDERFYALMDQIGTWDLSLMMFFENPKDQRNFIMELKDKFSEIIQSHESVIHFDQYYFTHLSDGVIKELKERVKPS